MVRKKGKVKILSWRHQKEDWTLDCNIWKKYGILYYIVLSYYPINLYYNVEYCEWKSWAPHLSLDNRPADWCRWSHQAEMYGDKQYF